MAALTGCQRLGQVGGWPHDNSVRRKPAFVSAGKRKFVPTSSIRRLSGENQARLLIAAPAGVRRQQKRLFLFHTRTAFMSASTGQVSCACGPRHNHAAQDARIFSARHCASSNHRVPGFHRRICAPRTKRTVIVRLHTRDPMCFCKSAPDTAHGCFAAGRKPRSGRALAHAVQSLPVRASASPTMSIFNTSKAPQLQEHGKRCGTMCCPADTVIRDPGAAVREHGKENYGRTTITTTGRKGVA